MLLKIIEKNWIGRNGLAAPTKEIEKEVNEYLETGYWKIQDIKYNSNLISINGHNQTQHNLLIFLVKII